jgi:hypothetical protein
MKRPSSAQLLSHPFIAVHLPALSAAPAAALIPPSQPTFSKSAFVLPSFFLLPSSLSLLPSLLSAYISHLHVPSVAAHYYSARRAFIMSLIPLLRSVTALDVCLCLPPPSRTVRCWLAFVWLLSKLMLSRLLFVKLVGLRKKKKRGLVAYFVGVCV